MSYVMLEREGTSLSSIILHFVLLLLASFALRYYLVATEQDIEELSIRCGFLLLPLFRLGYQWITRFLGLALYAMLLMPGFIQGEYKKDALFQSIHIERMTN